MKAKREEVRFSNVILQFPVLKKGLCCKIPVFLGLFLFRQEVEGERRG